MGLQRATTKGQRPGSSLLLGPEGAPGLAAGTGRGEGTGSHGYIVGGSLYFLPFVLSLAPPLRPPRKWAVPSPVGGAAEVRCVASLGGWPVIKKQGLESCGTAGMAAT